MYSKLYELEATVKASIENHDYSNSLEGIKNFVSSVMGEQSTPGEVVGSRRVDELCEMVGDSFFEKHFKPSLADGFYKANPNRLVIVCTGLYKYGGTSLVISDLVRAHPGYECTVIATNYLENMTQEDLELSRIGDSSATVSICPSSSPDQRLHWLVQQFITISPSRIFLLNHHQDSVIIAAARPFVDKAKVLFYHHADYNICLGVHMAGAIHVDPHNVGFYNCRHKEHIRDNVYIPMTVDDIGLNRVGSKFIQSNELTTCSSGHFLKFRNFYLYQYADLIVDRFKVRNGNHIHIGGLPDDDIANIRNNLQKSDIDPDRFVHIPWTASLWRTMIDRNVDLFIGSFPIGGARTTIEVMGAGIPILMPDNYLSRFFSSRDIVYRDAFVWKYPEDFSSAIANLNAKSLQMHSSLSRAHYVLNYSSSSLDIKERIDAFCAGTPTPTPYDLYPYFPDQLDKAMHFATLDALTSGYAVQAARASFQHALHSTTPSIARSPKDKRISRSLSTFIDKASSKRSKLIEGVQRRLASGLDRAKSLPSIVAGDESASAPLSREAEELYRAICANPNSVGLDPAIYLNKNPDVAQSGVDPIRHLVEFGQYEGREASLFFSTDWHAEMNEAHAGSIGSMLLHLARTRTDPSKLKVAFFSYAWNYARRPDPYMREMIAALADIGVNVDVYIGGMFSENAGTKGVRTDLTREDIGAFVSSQSYDFAISFNNSLIFDETVNALDCKIVSVLVDSVHHLFEHTMEGLLQPFSLPIHAAPIYTSFIDDHTKHGDFKASASFLPAATKVKRADAKRPDKQIEISWIASFVGDPNLDAFMSRVEDEVPDGLSLVARCLQGIESTGHINLDEETQEAAKALCAWSHWDYPLLEMHLQEIVTNTQRLNVVEKLAPLGLKVYGNARWRTALTLSQGVSKSFRSGSSLRSHEDLRDVYDQSKISINIPQIHAGTGMQYRIIDILASDSLLITKHVPGSDMEKLFGQNSPIVTFTDLDDLYAKCAYYLENEDERRALVKECNALVASGFDFRDRAREYLTLSNPADAKRVGASKGRGSITLIWPERVIEWAAHHSGVAASQ